MKKIALLLVVVSVFGQSMPAMAAEAMSPGVYKASQNINVRALPNFSGALINHYIKANEVKVTAVSGKWCKVDLAKYRSAYVYCPLLTDGVVSTAVESDAVTKLKAYNSWLNDSDSLGKNYINSSLSLGRNQAYNWAQDAYFGGVNFNYSDKSKDCSFGFASDIKPTEKFEFGCLDQVTGKVNGEILNNSSKRTLVNDPTLKLSALTKQLLDKAELVANINKQFAGSNKASLQMLLMADSDGVANWRVTIDNGLKSMTITTPANNKTAQFSVN